jgi:hypothetical protein
VKTRGCASEQKPEAKPWRSGPCPVLLKGLNASYRRTYRPIVSKFGLWSLLAMYSLLEPAITRCP